MEEEDKIIVEWKGNSVCEFWLAPPIKRNISYEDKIDTIVNYIIALIEADNVGIVYDLDWLAPHNREKSKIYQAEVMESLLKKLDQIKKEYLIEEAKDGLTIGDRGSESESGGIGGKNQELCSEKETHFTSKMEKID